MSTFVRYRDIAPATTDLRELRANLAAVRERFGRGSSQGREAFQHLVREHARQGNPIDGLRRYSPDETERFFSHTIPGPDGHLYWDGPQQFTRNDKKTRSPLRWHWEHTRGPLKPTDEVVADCGDKHCINTEHARQRSRGETRTLYRDEQMLGALQVLAMRLGYSPTTAQWQQSGMKPSHESFQNRFGTWGQALQAAGLPPVDLSKNAPPQKQKTPIPKIMEALRVSYGVLGHWPSYDEFDKHPAVQAALDERRLVRSSKTITRRLGKGWRAAIEEAKAAL